MHISIRFQRKVNWHCDINIGRKAINETNISIIFLIQIWGKSVFSFRLEENGDYKKWKKKWYSIFALNLNNISRNIYITSIEVNYSDYVSNTFNSYQKKTLILIQFSIRILKGVDWLSKIKAAEHIRYFQSILV